MILNIYIIMNEIPTLSNAVATAQTYHVCNVLRYDVIMCVMII